MGEQDPQSTQGQGSMDNVSLDDIQQPAAEVVINECSEVPTSVQAQAQGQGESNCASPAAPSIPKDDLVRKLMGVFAVASSLSIFLWFMAGAGFPWFIYIVYSVALIDCIIYGVKTKNGFFINWTIYATTNIMLFLTFLASGGGYPWFLMPACSMAIAPVAQYIYKSFPSPLRWLYIHAAIYVLINSMLFFIWMIDSRHNPYPWFIYPWGAWGVLLLIQYNAVVMHDKSRLFVLICADIGVMLMITFRFAIGPLFMVFVFIALIAAVAYYAFLKKGYIAHCWCVKRNNQQAAPTQPPAPQGQVPTQDGQVPPQPFYQNLPQFHVQFQAPPPPHAYQGQPVYYQSPPNPYYQPQGAPNGPSYYAYFPSNTGLYPTITTVPPTGPAVPTDKAPTVSASVPIPGSAVLTSDVQQEEKGKGKARDEDDEEGEGGHLLRNSPTRTYYITPPDNK